MRNLKIAPSFSVLHDKKKLNTVSDFDKDFNEAFKKFLLKMMKTKVS